ncbi:GtrA family protein [Xanthomonadaceae bacterium JHOS43]|nr:GtrA family protein [Xanthomonadaceae bacterium JHOS43]MCX7564161.1 GtrA family protein [Xanthomonadaceae bacterium XH05]
MRRLLLFGIAGTLGFLVDAGVVSMLVHGLGRDPYIARVVSFLCAVATTFAFNRQYTFAERPRRRGQAGHYLVAMMCGFAVNYGVYALLVHQLDVVRAWPVIGVAAGSLAGLIINYLTSSRWVFIGRHTR